jgi:O-antigen/teichoic acid export membrane protein
MISRNTFRQMTRNLFDLASGDIPARLCGIASLLILARKWGVLFVGVYALAQSMVQYTYPFIDFGLRHVGARLIAKYPQAGGQIVERVQRRRMMMGAAILPFLLGYALLSNTPFQLKMFLFFFSAMSCLYAVSLEWAAWGKEHMRLIAATKMMIPGSVLLFLLLGLRSQHVLWWLVAGNAVGYITQGIVFYRWWRQWRPASEQRINLAAVRESLAWSRTSVMGLAWFCNLAFNTIDMLMLGVMSNPHQVGLYSAAYRIMNQVLFTYYLLTQILYPRHAKQDAAGRARALRPRILVTLFAAGAAIAFVLSVSRKLVVDIVFGHQFLPATLLLALLAWAIPLDFVTSYLSNAYIAWSMEKKVLICTAVGAASNVILNLIWIPTYGATAAAVNTLVSYVIFLAALAFAGRYAKELTYQPQAEASVA